MLIKVHKLYLPCELLKILERKRILKREAYEEIMGRMEIEG